MREIDVRDAGLTAIVSVATVLTLHFIGDERYFLGLPAVLAILVCLCLVRRESVPLRVILLPAIILSSVVYALVAAGIGFPAAFVLGLILGGCGAALWFLRRHGSAVDRV